MGNFTHFWIEVLQILEREFQGMLAVYFTGGHLDF